MSLTQDKHVFAALTETGIRTLLRAVLTARPHYFNYGSSAFVPSNTAAATTMAPIPFPGVPGGIQWAAGFDIPVLTLFPPTGSSPLPPIANGFNVHVAKVTLQIASAKVQLELWALGEVLSQYFGPGTGSINLKIDKVLLVGIQPPGLEMVLENLIQILLASAVGGVSLPFQAFSLGAFKLILQQGPLIDEKELFVRGDIS